MQSPTLFAALTNRSILDQRFATSLNDETLTILNDLAKYLRTRINSEGTRIATQKRLERLLADVEKRTEQVYSDIQELYFEQFRELSIDEADFVAASMQSVVVGDVVVESVSNQRLWNAITKNPLSLGNDNGYVNFKKMIEDLGDNAAKVASMISGGYAEGLTNQEIVQGLIGTRANGYSDGIIDKSRRDANAIVRTALNHVTTEARNEVYKQNNDIVYGYRIVATIDTRTSAICRGHDQKVVRYTDKFQPLPPYHFSCRTTTIPEMYDKYLNDTGATRAVNFKKQGDIKAGKVGQVSAQQQYYEILKRQPAAQQDLVLGKARGLIFRNSGLSADEFRKAMTDTMGNPLTLKEMARENKKILDYMQSNKFLDGYVD
jgi:SPP1 gp7 family putative phage head morphogenesis protein